MATGFSPPLNVDHMFGGWLQGRNKLLKSVFLLGAVVLCRALWICRNDLVFKKKKSIVLLCRLSLRQHIGFRVGLFSRGRRFSTSAPSCNGVANIDEGGLSVFFPDAWVAI